MNMTNKDPNAAPDWGRIAQPTIQTTYLFRSELYDEILQGLYKRHKDNTIDAVPKFLATIREFPEIKKLFNSYIEELDYSVMTPEIVFAFLRKLSITFEMASER